MFEEQPLAKPVGLLKSWGKITIGGFGGGGGGSLHLQCLFTPSLSCTSTYSLWFNATKYELSRCHDFFYFIQHRIFFQLFAFLVKSFVFLFSLLFLTILLFGPLVLDLLSLA